MKMSRKIYIESAHTNLRKIIIGTPCNSSSHVYSFEITVESVLNAENVVTTYQYTQDAPNVIRSTMYNFRTPFITSVKNSHLKPSCPLSIRTEAGYQLIIASNGFSAVTRRQNRAKKNYRSLLLWKPLRLVYLF